MPIILLLALALSVALAISAGAQTRADCKAAVAAIRAVDPHNASPEDKAEAIARVRRICAERFPDQDYNRKEPRE